MNNEKTRRSYLKALSALSVLGCGGASELSHWRLLYSGLEYQVKVREFSGNETVYVDWQRQAGIGPELARKSVQGSHRLGSEILIRSPSLRTWQQPSALIMYNLINRGVIQVEYPFVRVVETLSGVPGIGLVTSGVLELVRRTERVESGIFFRRTLSTDSEWELASYDIDSNGARSAVGQRRMWSTGELGIIVYSERKTIYRHNLLDKRRERIGSGDFASASVLLQ